MRSEVIRADSIDAATEEILGLLKEDAEGNVIYFDGWEGMGASAVLRAVAQRLAVASEAPAGLQFEKIIQVDCSKWESRRALQRAVAEQLELPTEVMEMFDRQDEVDDYHGLDLGSRLAVPQVQKVMHRHIQNLSCRFLVILRNGGSEEIDLASFGFPLSEYLDNKVLWTFQERFRLYPRIKIREALHKSTATNKTDIFLSASISDKRDPQEFWSILVWQEAAEIVKQSMIVSTRGISIDQQQAYSFILHILKLCCIGHHLMMDFDLATHASNYWICDGILHQLQREDVHGDELLQADNDGDGLWQAADALKREMLLDVDYYKCSHGYFPSHLVRYATSKPEWTWPPFGVLPVPAGIIFNADMFHDHDKLSVLKLSRRTFNFSSPPFAHCRNLKFLWLDNCHDDQGMNKVVNPDGATGMALQRCVGGLLVLHLLNTCYDQLLSAQMMDFMTHLRELNVMGTKDWDMGQLQGRLPSIRKLRVTKSKISCSSRSPSENDDLFSGMKKMELFDFSGNHIMGTGMRSLILAAKKNLLENIITDEGCVGLEQVSFSGCANLKNLLLRGLFKELKSIDISGTTVKTLDLGALAAPSLDEVIALGCSKLCAILWPHETKRKEDLIKIHISTKATSSSSSLTVKYGSLKPTEYSWYVSVKDARLLQSLVPISEYYFITRLQSVHMEISSVEENRILESSVGGGQLVSVNLQTRQQLLEVNSSASVYADITFPASDDDDGDAPPITLMWPCPHVPLVTTYDSYMYIQDLPIQRTPGAGNMEVVRKTSSSIIIVPDIICDFTRILHVRDSKFITRDPGPGPLEGSRRKYLRWCRVERCPSLECVFVCPQAIGSREDKFGVCPYLNTLWCSQLLNLRCIWSLSRPSSALRPLLQNLDFMHLDFCPRLIHVLPLSPNTQINTGFLRCLETLEMVWCGDLRGVILPDADAHQSHEDQRQQQEAEISTVNLPSLKRVHLHELPMLHGIFGRGGMVYAPNLESIKIRGCWSLSRLPAVGTGSSYDKKVECDCEKEWWDKLRWDGKDNRHHPSLYTPMHPRHYKKVMLRTSVLR